MPGTFEVKKAKDGQAFFHLKAANGKVILASEMYKTEQSALNGIESVKKNAPLAERYQRVTSQNGKFYFVLRASNSQVIGNSEMYESESSRENGIESVMKNAPTANTLELVATP